MNYFIHQGDEAYGPYTPGQLPSMWGACQVTGETVYCEEGGEDWFHLRILEAELDPPAPPPLPPVVATRPFVPRRKSSLGLAIFITGGILAALVIFVIVFGSLSSSDDTTVTDQYARMVNAFA